MNHVPVRSLIASVCGRYWICHSVLTIRDLAGHGLMLCHRNDRARALEQIKNDSATLVLLANLGSAGGGLNLQCCSVVCLLEPWWNPAIEVSPIALHLIWLLKSP